MQTKRRLVQNVFTLTCMLCLMVPGKAGCVGEELEADFTLDKGFQVSVGLVQKHLWVGGPVVVPQT